MDDPGIGFIGAGVLGNGLAMALHARGYRIVAAASRSLSSARRLAARVPGCRPVERASDLARDCDLVFITTPDEAIGLVAASIRWQSGQGVVHCSGAATLDVLEKAATAGASVGSFHPLQTLACLEAPEEAESRLAGITYAIDGQGWVVDFLYQVAERLGGKRVRLRPRDRALYHAAAVLACGHVTTLLKAAVDLWQEMGHSPQEAQASLAPLAAATVANFSRAGPEKSATGPIVRGDTATVVSHLEELERRMPRLVPLLCVLGLESLSLIPEGTGAESSKQLKALLVERLGIDPSAP